MPAEWRMQSMSSVSVLIRRTGHTVDGWLDSKLDACMSDKLSKLPLTKLAGGLCGAMLSTPAAH